MPKFEAVNEELIRRLAEVYKASMVGDFVTYDALSSAIGMDVKAYRYLIPPAKILANEESGAMFRTVRGIGYERIPNAQAHGKDQSVRRRARKMFGATQKQIMNAIRHANDLKPDEYRKNITSVTHLGILIHQTYDRNAPVIPPEAMPPDPARVAMQSIEAMRSSLGRTK